MKHREVIFATFCGDTPYDRYKVHVVKTLFSGDIRRTDRVEVIDIMGLGKRRLLHLLCGVGLKCLLSPGAVKLLQRKNWIGCHESIDRIGLPTFVCGLFMAIYLRAIQLSGLIGDGDRYKVQGVLTNIFC